jgi:hypothetical protein
VVASKLLPMILLTIFYGKNSLQNRFVDDGIFKLIGECPTPWPCFVIASRDSFINLEYKTIKRGFKYYK